jgi:heme-degrading monooxygenase HmoA
MVVVIFESQPHPERKQAYLEAGARLGPLVRQHPGFVSIERFESLVTPGKLLALSTFEDEQAVREWRNLEIHRSIQNTSRSSLFADYRLRVASVLRDYGMNDRAGAPDDSILAHGA